MSPRGGGAEAEGTAGVAAILYRQNGNRINPAMAA